MSTDSDATGLRVETAGDPDHPLVVLSHGAMDRSAGMLRLSRRLSTDHFVIRYDRRGYGRSQGVGPPHTLHAHIDDLEHVLDTTAPNRRVDLAFGHSLGGNVVLGLASRLPDRFDRAAVYEMPMSWLEWWPGNTAGAAAVDAGDPADAAEAFMRRLVGDAVWERLPAGTRAARRAEGAAMVGEIADLQRSAPWDPMTISIPVLAIGGENGRPHHQRGMRLLADLIESASFVQLDDAGHGAPNSHATELAELLAGFLTDSDG